MSRSRCGLSVGSRLRLKSRSTKKSVRRKCRHRWKFFARFDDLHVVCDIDCRLPTLAWWCRDCMRVLVSMHPTVSPRGHLRVGQRENIQKATKNVLLQSDLTEAKRFQLLSEYFWIFSCWPTRNVLLMSADVVIFFSNHYSYSFCPFLTKLCTRDLCVNMQKKTVEQLVKFIKQNQKLLPKTRRFDLYQRPSSAEAGTQFFRFLTRREDAVSRKWSCAWLSW